MDIKEIEARIERYNQEVMRKEYEKETLEKEITSLLDTYGKQTGVVLDKNNKEAIQAEIKKVKGEFDTEVAWYTEFFGALDSGDEVKQHELLSGKGLTEESTKATTVTQEVVEPVVEQPVVESVVEPITNTQESNIGVTDDTLSALNNLGGKPLVQNNEESFATVDDLMMNLGDLKL